MRTSQPRAVKSLLTAIPFLASNGLGASNTDIVLYRLIQIPCRLRAPFRGRPLLLVKRVVRLPKFLYVFIPARPELC